MSYKPIQVDNKMQMSSALSTMAPKGVNLRTPPQFLDVDQALNIQNYEIEDTGRLVKRLGLYNIYDSGTEAITMFEQWTSDIWMVGFGTTLAYYTKSTGVLTNIKTDFSVNEEFSGKKYGDYFFLCNGVDKVWYMTISDLTTVTQIAASPAEANHMAVIGARLFVSVNDSVRYSEIDDGTNPPFQTWTEGTLATDGGSVSYRNAGNVRSIVPLGANVVVFSDDGFYSFVITLFDSAGTTSKTEDIANYVEDFGGARGAISTEKGIFYTNEAGLWNLVSVGQTDIPYSRQYSPVSYSLGNTYFDNADFTRCDLYYDQKKRVVYVTAGQGSQTNNVVLAYHTEYKAFYTITGWNISRFLNDNGVMYGASDAKTALYKLFTGYTDDGLIIGTDYRQEISLGEVEYRKKLLGVYTQGFLSQSSLVKVRFDAYNEKGRITTDKLKYDWTAQYATGSGDGYNSAIYSSSVYGGDSDDSGLVECFDGARPFISNLQRLQLHITSADEFPHVLTWVKLGARIKSKCRVRTLSQTT
jgi:hypothetical protein